MAAATVLYVGEDICGRIPVLQRTGFTVFRSKCSLADIRQAVETSFVPDLVLFCPDSYPMPPLIVSAISELTHAPLILFENPDVPCDEGAFDLVIPMLTAPDIWVSRIHTAIEASRSRRAASLQERQESADFSIPKKVVRTDPNATRSSEAQVGNVRRTR